MEDRLDAASPGAPADVRFGALTFSIASGRRSMPTSLAFVTDVGSIQRMLAYLGEPRPGPRIALAACGPPPCEKHFHPDAGTHPSEPAASESRARKWPRLAR